MDDLLPVFYNQETDSLKKIDCICVKEASDEGLAHEVVGQSGISIMEKLQL